MSIASAFLSHSSQDKPLVEAVAEALGQRGILPWLDQYCLTPGISLNEQLKKAIGEQNALVLFLSQDSLTSPWVKDEIREAIKLEKENHYKDWIIPVFLDTPIKLVQANSLLYDHWLHPDGNRVERLGIEVCSSYRETLDTSAKEIAEKIAQSVYRLLKFENSPDLNIYLDQRGNGVRRGQIELPSNIDKLGTPTLVFRPDIGEKSFVETLISKDWTEFRDQIKHSLSRALGDLRIERKIRILGNSQLGLTFLMGRCFDRLTAVSLYCYNINPKFKTTLTNAGQASHRLIVGGDPYCETTLDDNPQDSLLPKKILIDEKPQSIALYIGKRDYLKDVRDHLESALHNLPLVFIQTEYFETSEEVMALVKNVIALLRRLKEAHGTTKVRLYCDLPFNVVPLLAASLTHAVNTIEFMEYRKDLQNKNVPPGEMYEHLPMED